MRHQFIITRHAGTLIQHATFIPSNPADPVFPAPLNDYSGSEAHMAENLLESWVTRWPEETEAQRDNPRLAAYLWRVRCAGGGPDREASETARPHHAPHDESVGLRSQRSIAITHTTTPALR